MKLIIINSIFNLMLSVQLRRTFLKKDKVEIILTDSTPSFEDIYKCRILEGVFDNIYYGKLVGYKVNKKNFFDPQYALKLMLECRPKKYTDIFFWNNDFIFYNFYKWYSITNHKCSYHLYGDAMSAYILDAPDDKKKFGLYSGEKARILNMLDKYIYKYTRVADMNYDYYIFNKDMFIGDSNRKIVNILPIDIHDMHARTIYNNLFNYQGYNIQQKYIYLDTARDGYITDQDVLDVLANIVNLVGKENIIVKPHPRVDEKIYKDLGVQLFDKDVPWEIYCLNNNIEDKTVICSLTSAAVMPYILYGIVNTVVCVCDLIPNRHPNLKQLRDIYQTINELERNIVFISCQKEMEQYFDNI